MPELSTQSKTEIKTIADNSPLVDVQDVYKSFGDNHVLKGFDLQLFEGENLVVLGKSGVGKSVLIKCMVGLLKPDRGTLKVFDQEIAKLNQAELDEIRGDIGFLFQGNALYDSMTVRENLEFPMRRHPEILSEKSNKLQLIEEALESVGLLETMDMMPEELSGGMKKRVALARTLILRPKIILYDEPTTGLDPVTANEINNLILKVQKQYDTASLIITHDMDCAKITANRMIILIDGVNYLEGTYEDMVISEDPKIKAFFV